VPFLALYCCHYGADIACVRHQAEMDAKVFKQKEVRCGSSIFSLLMCCVVVRLCPCQCHVLWCRSLSLLSEALFDCVGAHASVLPCSLSQAKLQKDLLDAQSTFESDNTDNFRKELANHRKQVGSLGSLDFRRAGFVRVCLESRSSCSFQS
jgi:hypothetical protein